jgi:hypothetical protein
VYQTQFLVVEVNTLPVATHAGASLNVVFEVEYADGSPAQLNPQLASFLVLSPTYSDVYSNVLVTPTGTPGEYQTSIVLPSDIPPGTYTLYCIHCTLTDGKGNFAPNSDISSNETPIKSNSIFTVGAVVTTTAYICCCNTTTTAPPLGFVSTSLLVGLWIPLIIILILIAALLLRGQQKKKE